MGRSTLVYILIVTAFGFVGCTAQYQSGEGQLSKYDVNKYAVNKTVCNPLTPGTPPSDPSKGIHANLYYLNPGQPQYSTVSDMIANGTKSQQDLFFSDINVPTRMFSEGFPLQSGGLVKDDAGNELIEWFAIRFQGTVHLGEADVEGDYQLGMLSDDGAVLSLSSNSEESNYTIMVDDDGVHPTRMDCGPTINMSRSTNLAMKLDYFQGPRYHISVIPLWRPINQSSAQETLCGATGNSTFFDPNNNSNPLTAYMQLLARGWRPLGAANYSVSTSTVYNPCVDGTPPVISNMVVGFNLESAVLNVTWTTDIPATDQVLITNLTTGTTSLTTSDNVLRTQHAAHVSGVIFAGEHYNVQAVSISDDLGKTISAAVPFSL